MKKIEENLSLKDWRVLNGKKTAVKKKKTDVARHIGGVFNPVPRVDSQKIYEERVAFNEAHFGCKKFYHRPHGTKKSWETTMAPKPTPERKFKRVLYILVPAEMYAETDIMRTKKIYHRDERHHVVKVTTEKRPVIAHGEHAAKAILLKQGIPAENILTSKNLCCVLLHNQVSVERIKQIFPTLSMRVFREQK